MALALNVFKTVAADITTGSTIIYTAPTGYTGIVLMAQITNVTNTTGQVTFLYNNGVTDTELLKNFQIPAYDAASGLSGKLVVQTGNTVAISANANNTLKITLSILETAND